MEVVVVVALTVAALIAARVSVRSWNHSMSPEGLAGGLLMQEAF
jgi:hypothetical protein